MNPDKLFDDFVAGFPARKFSAGLLVAFIDMLLALDSPSSHFADFEAFLAAHPQEFVTAASKHANTLIVRNPAGGTTSRLRPFYNAIERYFRAENKRFDYPSCAPHATRVMD